VGVILDANHPSLTPPIKGGECTYWIKINMMEYRNLGRMIWIATIAITLVGLVTIYSASAHNVRVSQIVFFQQIICSLV
jgi:hypothetical protein